MMTWREALADCKGTYLTEGAAAATELAARYLADHTISPGDYIALVRWTEQRPSWVAHLFE